MICSRAYFVVNIFWNWCNYGGHFQFGKLIFHRNVWWHRFPLGTACQNFPESESQLKLKIWGAPTFKKLRVPFLNVHFFLYGNHLNKKLIYNLFNHSTVDSSPSPCQEQKLYIWVSIKVNFNFFGRLSAFATEWWMQGCTLKPSAPKVFTNSTQISPSLLGNCEIIFKFLKNCKDALEMPSAPKVLTNSRKSQEAAANDLYQGSNNHQVQYRDDTDLHLKGWSIDHFGEELIQKWPFFMNQQ